jgi:hypothetical protein
MHNRRSKTQAILKLTLAFTAIATPPARALSLGRVVEPPPAIYASGPTRSGRTYELQLESVEAVDYLCRVKLHGMPQGARRGSYYMSCYDPQLDAVIIMQPKAWPSRREWNLIREHEWAHARGWRHKANGEGTDWAGSLPPRGARLASAAAQDAARDASARTGALN